ncbi:MAG: O-antigen ligase family protein [bacterium]
MEETEREQNLTIPNKYAIQLLVVCLIMFATANIFHFKLGDLGISPYFLLYTGATLALFLAYLNIELALILFIYTIPVVTYSIPGLPFFFTFADAFLIVLVIVWLSRAILKKEFTLYQTFLDRYLFIFILLSIVSLFNSRDFGHGLSEVVQTLEFFVFSYYFFCTVVKKRELLSAVFQAITFSSVFFSLYGIHQYFINGGGDFRVFSTLGHFNAFGAYLSMMILMIFNFMLSERNRLMRLVYLAVLGVDLIALILTFSRGAWIAMVAGIMVSAWLRGLTQFVKAFTAIVMFFIMLSMVAPPAVIGRASSITRVDDKSSVIRLKQYGIAVETMSRYPLLGVGIMSMDAYVWEEYNWYGAGKIHNLFLWVGSERGIPAMLCLLAIFGVFFIKAREKIEQADEELLRSCYIGLFSALLTYFIINLTALHLVRGLGIFLGMFLGLFQAIAKIEEGESSHQPYFVSRATTILRR